VIFLSNLSESEILSALLERTNAPGHFTSELGLVATRIEHFLAEGVITPGMSARNPRGILHGGLLYTLMDHLAGIAACTTGRSCVTLDTSVNYYRQANAGEKLTCTAEVIKAGHTITVCAAHIRNEAGKEVCAGTFTYYMMEDLEHMPTIEEN
jgi:acyl-CoA thioesterase